VPLDDLERAFLGTFDRYMFGAFRDKRKW